MWSNRRSQRPLFRLGAAVLLALQTIAPAGVVAQSTAQSAQQPETQQPAMQDSETMSQRLPVVTAASAAHEKPLNDEERVLQVLNRLTYGPRPGELERVRAMGLNAWLSQQLNPSTIDDSALERRLKDYPAMQLPLLKLMEMYPNNNTIRATMDGRAGRPGGEAEKAIYASQMERYKQRKDAKDGNPAMSPDPKPVDAQAILAPDPAKRFSALCKLTVPQLRMLRRSLPEDQREHLTDGFTPQQIEALAAFNGPQGVVAAEAVQTKLLRDLYSERQLNEMMVDFWLNHFNVYMRKSQQAPYYIAAYERDAIRPNAMGRFENLLAATAMSPAMLNYLDNAASIGPHSQYAHPQLSYDRRGFPNLEKPRTGVGLNENYARELMELHTLGVNGGYTQHDVTEVAKVFTGWTVGKGRGADEAAQAQFDPTKHEPGSKHILGETIKDDGAGEGMKVLHILANSPATARFISTKIAVRFVSDDPPKPMVDRMTSIFLETHGDIRHVLLAMLQSPEFFSRASYRAKVKTPQDYVLSAVRASGAEVASTSALAGVIAELGMPLYGMQTPNGYSMRADAWNNTAALVSRMNFALALSTNRVAGVHTDWPVVMGHPEESLTPEQKDSVLEDRILHMQVSDRTRQTILAQIDTDPEQQARNLRQISAKKSNDPLSNARGRNEKPPIEEADNQAALAAGLIFGSPEFQRR
ncbi:Uncharacterized conserved protein, DUF1800 family [Granulicella rosea]|uniref:Uncharacterized conserved protein, DUF1800 family n=1 Tax=Granulicella rosea TaxID=474952 RepID=A0A239JBR4_9BACT|nr:DUF1800 domain-containing protein [Granulicella rosea]SNT02733.1 Uncharacterized conserved protein, DUF1800 family [Granulicella rosea]